MKKFLSIVSILCILLSAGCAQERTTPQFESSPYIDGFIRRERNLSQIEESTVQEIKFNEFTALRLGDIIMEEYWGEEPFRDTICVIAEYPESECYAVERRPKDYKKEMPIYQVVLSNSGAILHVEKIEKRDIKLEN